MSYIFCPKKEQEKIAERFNKLRNDIDDIIQEAYEELSSLLVVFKMFQDTMIVHKEEAEQTE